MHFSCKTFTLFLTIFQLRMKCNVTCMCSRVVRALQQCRVGVLVPQNLPKCCAPLMEVGVFVLIIRHTHTQTFNGLFSRTAWVGRYQKDKPFWILLKQEMMGWQWHQLNRMQIICTSLLTDSYASTSSLHIFTGRMPFLPPNQQRQSTEGKNVVRIHVNLLRLQTCRRLTLQSRHTLGRRSSCLV